MTWVWENSTAAGNERLVLLAIADAADDSGRGAYPSIATLARKTRLSQRTIQRTIKKLVDGGHLVVDKNGGGRWSNAYLVVLHKDDPAEQSGTPTGDHTDEATTGKSGDGPENPLSTTGVRLTPRQSDTGDAALSPQGCHSSDTAGVTQLCHPTRPITVLEPSTSANPSKQPDGGGGRRPRQGEPDPAVAAVLADLPPDWKLGTRSARRLSGPIRSALEAGWSPAALARQLGANPEGVRNPYAVLAARLDDLPAPPAKRAERRPWCGQCDHADTRLIELVDGKVAPCPECHPKGVAA